MKLRHIIIVTTLAMTACGQSTPEKSYDDFTTQGVEAARQFLLQSGGNDEISIIAHLLDVRVVYSTILKHDGQEAADAFTSGFENYIKANNDSLYNLITTSTSTDIQQ